MNALYEVYTAILLMICAIYLRIMYQLIITNTVFI